MDDLCQLASKSIHSLGMNITVVLLVTVTASVSKFMLISVYIYLQNMLKLGNLVPVGLSVVSTRRPIRQIDEQTQCFCETHIAIL